VMLSLHFARSLRQSCACIMDNMTLYAPILGLAACRFTIGATRDEASTRSRVRYVHQGRACCLRLR
jgi:hypothetical protein